MSTCSHIFSSCSLVFSSFPRLPIFSHSISSFLHFWVYHLWLKIKLILSNLDTKIGALTRPPSDYFTSGQDGCEGGRWCGNLSNFACRVEITRKLSTAEGISPRHHGAIGQHCNKRPGCCTHPVHQFEAILHFTAVTTKGCIAPSDNAPILAKRSERTRTGNDTLHVSQLISDAAAVTSITWISPSHNRSVAKDCSKCTTGAANLSHIFQLVLNWFAVSTKVDITPSPSHHLSTFDNCSKCTLGTAHLLHVDQPALHFHALTSGDMMAPSDQTSICPNGCKCLRSGADLLDIIEVTLDGAAVTTEGRLAPCNNMSRWA